MITVGCAGFPVPATRYFREFSFVEVQETHVSLPGPGTIRRWRREAPNGFRFALLGPREVGQEGFRDGKVIKQPLGIPLTPGVLAGASFSRMPILFAVPDDCW